MVEFRKAFLLLAVLVFATGLASAQISPLQCVANAGVPPIARAEGVAEEVGQVIISCTGGASTPTPLAIPTINVQIFLNTNITSRLLDSTGTRSEALLLIDEPVGLEQVEAATVPNVATVAAAGDGTYKTPGVAGRPTVFGAQQASVNSLVWLNIPFDPPGTGGKNRVLRLVNVRANANQLGVGSSLIPNQISMFISISGTASLALNNPQLTVAFIQPGMKFGATAATYNQCEPGIKTYKIGFAELFGTAFRHQRSVGDQNIPGSIYNTESMFYSSAFTKVGAVGAGLATQGTRLSARFSNVPANVTITVPVNIDSHIYNTATPPVATQINDTAALVSSGTNGSTANATTGVVTLTGGAGAAVWEVLTSNPGAISTLSATVSVEYKASPLPGLGTATVAGNYAPVAATLTASTEAAPRFVENPQSATTFTINSCRTNLLFPFVSNQASFDTGIAISNTSKDPFGTVAQRGPCTINYYSATNAPAAQTSITINEGEQLIFNVSLGNATQNIVPTPGFQGYIIAQCNFQYAHGYAFLSTPTQGGLAQGYLALVMDKNMYSTSATTTRSGATSEPLDN